jgi:ABC-type multidrug transport system ATPase subunit
MLLERLDLWEVRHERVQTLSRGMQQRLGLCRVLLHEPDLLVLDEPFNALDADGAARLDRALEELRSRSTFAVATHDPARIDHLATDRVAFA